MKTLVYTTAFGEPHFFMLAEEMLRSLRKRGYAGDAVVLSDRMHDFPAELDARVVVGSVNPARLFKASLHLHMDVSVYDRILFVDSDVVFLRAPDPLFALAEERLMVSRDHYPLRRNSFNMTFLTREERANPSLEGTRSINTGVLVFPARRYHEYCARWLEAWQSPMARRKLENLPMKSAELRDQPLMQWLVTAGNLDCGFIPDELLMMPLFFTENHAFDPRTVVFHLNGSSRTPLQKQKLLELMREVTTLDSAEAFTDLCARMQAGRRKASFPSLS